jgi:hypothetical protein
MKISSCDCRLSLQVERFWRVFRTMPDTDRSLFIRFAWGRARLPRPENWTMPFKITRKGGGDNQLPIAHTCFFQVRGCLWL